MELTADNSKDQITIDDTFSLEESKILFIRLTQNLQSMNS
jgi:hypothetical protein